MRLVIDADGRSGDAHGETEEAEEGGRLRALAESGVLPKLQPWLARVFAPELVVPPPPTGPPCSGSDSDSEPPDRTLDSSREFDRTDRESGDSRWTRFALLAADIMVDELGIILQIYGIGT